jgi:hypothetical protein
VTRRQPDPRSALSQVLDDQLSDSRVQLVRGVEQDPPHRVVVAGSGGEEKHLVLRPTLEVDLDAEIRVES